MSRLVAACLLFCLAMAFVARGGMASCAIAAATSQPTTAPTPAASCCEELAHRGDKHAPADHAMAEMPCCFVAATIDSTPVRLMFDSPRAWPAIEPRRVAGRTLEPCTPPPRSDA